MTHSGPLLNYKPELHFYFCLVVFEIKKRELFNYKHTVNTNEHRRVQGSTSSCYWVHYNTNCRLLSVDLIQAHSNILITGTLVTAEPQFNVVTGRRG